MFCWLVNSDQPIPRSEAKNLTPRSAQICRSSSLVKYIHISRDMTIILQYPCVGTKDFMIVQHYVPNFPLQDGHPQWCMLVYKPWNNPHELDMSYISTIFNIEFIQPLNFAAFLNATTIERGPRGLKFSNFSAWKVLFFLRLDIGLRGLLGLLEPTETESRPPRSRGKWLGKMRGRS